MPKRRLRSGKVAKKKTRRKTTTGGNFNIRPQSIFFYGIPGIGKSEFAAAFPRPFFIIGPQEDGIKDLVEYGQVDKPVGIETVEHWSKLDATMKLAAKADAQTIVVDSATDFERLCFVDFCNEHYNGVMGGNQEGFYAYSQGPKAAAKRSWPNLLHHLIRFREDGLHTVMIGHAQVKPFNDPERDSYDRWIPDLDKETWGQTHKWASCVLFMNYDTETKRSGTKIKAKKGVDGRTIYTSRTSHFDAKNRFRLPPTIDAGESGKEGFENFVNAFK